MKYLLQSTLLAVFSAFVAYSLRGTAPTPTTNHIEPTCEPTQVPVIISLTDPRTAQGALQFIKDLRQASSSDCQRYFQSTHETALRQAVILRWASIDPRACFEFLNEYASRVGDHLPKFSYGPLLFQVWAHGDKAMEAVTVLAEHAKEDWLDTAFPAFAQLASNMDGKLWKAILNDPRLTTRSFPYANFTHLSGQPNPNANVNVLRALAEARAGGFYELEFLCRQNGFGGQSGEQFQEMQSAWKALPTKLRNDMAGKLVQSLAERDLPAALNFLHQLPADQADQNAVCLAGAYAKQDPAGSWNWINENTLASRRGSLEQWAKAVPPSQGAEILAQAPPSNARDIAATTLAQAWITKDPTAATQWAQSLDDPNTQRQVYNSIALDWMRRDPEQAIAALTAPHAPALQRGTYSELAKRLRITNPTQAEAFLAALPPARSHGVTGNDGPPTARKPLVYD
jgi:hypothetical protein